MLYCVIITTATMWSVLRKDENDWMKRCIDYTVGGVKPRGRPKLTWKEIADKGLRSQHLT